jgi:hypothetical protein
MPLLITTLVIVLVFVFLRINRQARLRWLRQVDLPGLWHEQDSGSARIPRELRLLGSIASGDYRLLEGEREQRGQWRFQGDQLLLTAEQGEDEVFSLRLFKPGQISLQGAGGDARLFHKQADNVVSMQRPPID